MSSFTNPASCDRIVFGVITHLNRSWERKPPKEFSQKARHYLDFVLLGFRQRHLIQ
jgi:hypothetical protein